MRDRGKLLERMSVKEESKKNNRVKGTRPPSGFQVSVDCVIGKIADDVLRGDRDLTSRGYCCRGHCRNRRIHPRNADLP